MVPKGGNTFDMKHGGGWEDMNVILNKLEGQFSQNALSFPAKTEARLENSESFI